MKRFVTAAVFAAAAAFAAPAFADDQSDAAQKCDAKANEQVSASMPPDTPADQKQMVTEMVTDMCGCITSKVAELGDDGAKVLHVMAVQPDEDWLVQDEAEQQKRAIALLAKEYGMSEDDAKALYERINPKMKEISASCQQEAQAKLMEKMTPKAQ